MKAPHLLALLCVSVTAACGQSTETQRSALCCTEFFGGVRVMTLNAAHARGNAMHQSAVSDTRIRENLDRMADIAEREQVDILGLQEIDGDSQWNGAFDHVEYLAETMGAGWWVRGGHARYLWLDYGTAIMGNPALVEAETIKFKTFGPGFKKGFTVSTILLDGEDIDVVSLHLDPILGARRKKQIEQVIDHLSDRDNLRIIMGDFNVQYADGNPIDVLAEELDLEIYEPESDDLPTFEERRLDWILVSNEGLDIEDYYVVPDEVSDHKAVVAHVSSEAN